MTDREKLIKLIVTTPVPCVLVSGVRNGKYLCSAATLADHLLANGVTFAKGTDVPSKWISVEDRLPEPGVVVLVYSKLGCTYFSHRLYNHVEWKPFCIEYSGGWEVTHWMPLPEPPKED